MLLPVTDEPRQPAPRGWSRAESASFCGPWTPPGAAPEGPCRATTLVGGSAGEPPREPIAGREQGHPGQPSAPSQL